MYFSRGRNSLVTMTATPHFWTPPRSTRHDWQRVGNSHHTSQHYASHRDHTLYAIHHTARYATMKHCSLPRAACYRTPPHHNIHPPDIAHYWTQLHPTIVNIIIIICSTTANITITPPASPAPQAPDYHHISHICVYFRTQADAPGSGYSTTLRLASPIRPPLGSCSCGGSCSSR